MNKPIHKYVLDTLGLEMAPPVRMVAPAELPYLLHDAFDFFSAQIGGAPVILARPKATNAGSIAEITRKIGSVADKLNAVVVFCPDALASYERRNLIQSKTPFIVPGNQMYLPNLGIDLREHFLQQRPTQQVKLSPSTQAMLIFVLLNMPTQREWSPGDVGAALGYAPMTVSRAIRELAHAGLMEVVPVGRQKFLRQCGDPQQIWQRALPLLRTPVTKNVNVPAAVLAQCEPNSRLAGYSALAERSMLSAPQAITYAVPKQRWTPVLAASVNEYADQNEDLVTVQIWQYETGILANTPTVDPLSLWLSLRDDKDERVQLALESLMETVRW